MPVGLHKCTGEDLFPRRDAGGIACDVTNVLVQCARVREIWMWVQGCSSRCLCLHQERRQSSMRLCNECRGERCD